MQMVPIGRTQDPSSESAPVKQLGTRQHLIPWHLEHPSERRAKLEWRSLLSDQDQHVIAVEWNGAVLNGRRIMAGTLWPHRCHPPLGGPFRPPTSTEGSNHASGAAATKTDHCIPSALPLQPDRAVTA